jgi:hypothetical protein
MMMVDEGREDDARRRSLNEASTDVTRLHVRPSLANNYRQKARKARQRMERSPDPLVRSMWRAIAEQHEYLAEHVQLREESPRSPPGPSTDARR